ncbi:choline kinase family protein [Reyranella sp.]|uniref:choline kinase family protein n=1 Tax=Reyranella sp. TaxID=1929291 RepID=UPI002604FD71|nr:choline kinase family protein [Reyranella sp.]HQS18565.1 choline kinase family protein [Reyranella sp.]HQT15386.1 choline kinase family protein [Reyranella sp.]
MTDLERRIAGLACWRGPVTMAPLLGGLTNLSYVVEDADEKFVVRIGDDIPVHHVFRDRERAASIAAHAAGLSPEVVHAEPGILVMRHVDGRTFTEADLRLNIQRLALLLQKCHRSVAEDFAGPPNFFWVFHVIRDYGRTITGSESPFAVDVPRYLEANRVLEAAQVPMPIVFGHHDLLPGNVMDDGERLWLIDWEYGGFGTALFDLANLSANGAFGEAEDEALLGAYFEGKVPADLRRSFQAMKAASALREAMWAMVSDIHLQIAGADYKAHARDYLHRFEALMAR